MNSNKIEENNLDRIFTVFALLSLVTLIIVGSFIGADNLNQLHHIESTKAIEIDLSNNLRRQSLLFSLAIDTFFITGIVALLGNLRKFTEEESEFYSNLGFVVGLAGMSFDILENSIMFLLVNSIDNGFMPHTLLINLMFVFVYLKDTLLVISTTIFAVLIISKTFKTKRIGNIFLVIALLAVAVFGSIAIMFQYFTFLRNVSVLFTVVISIVIT